MWAQPESDEMLIQRLLPAANPDPHDRAQAWHDWFETAGGRAVLKFIRSQNHTPEADEDILQDSLLTAYADVERGGYEYRPGIPFAAYVKGIARNKIREARRRNRNWDSLDAAEEVAADSQPRQLESGYEIDEQRHALREALTRLPDRRRQVLECFLGGESVAAIAERLNMTADLVRQDKHRGLRILQRLGILN